ncbi:MAG: PAS domain S-box protein [Candidatus Omnitrophica bacterium]|nr:PAS domain S-box protein [Candidatus Omnitrophota bacterium]
MRLKSKFSAITFITVIFLSLCIEVVAIFIFYQHQNILIKNLFSEKLTKIISLAAESDELFFENLYGSEEAAKERFLDKLRVIYRKQKDAKEYPFVIKKDGSLLIHPYLPTGEKILNYKQVDFINKVRKGEIVYFYKGIKYWAIFENFKAWDWNFLMTIPVREKNKELYNFILVSSVATIFIAALSILLILILVNKYISIISVLNQKIDKISSGQIYFTEPEKEKYLFTTNDEISELAQNFVKMAEDLKSTTTSKNYLESIIKSISDILLVTDEQEKIVTVNDAAINILKYSADELIGKDIRFLFSHKSFVLDKLLENAEEKDFVENYDLTILTKENKELDVFLTFTVIRASDCPYKYNRTTIKTCPLYKKKTKHCEKVTGFIFLIKDITKYRQIQKELEKQRERTQLYFDIAGAMLLALDKNFNVLLANKKACQILEVTQEEIVGKNWLENFLPEEEKERIKEIFYKIIGGDISFEYVENYVLTKSGKKRLIAWHNVTIKDEKKEIIGTLSSGEDITEKKKLEQRILKLNNCFLNLSSDCKKNITNLIKLCEEVFEADGAFYNRIDKGEIFTIVASNPLLDLKRHNLKNGHICEYVIKNATYRSIVFRNLEQTHFAQEDPHILQYNFKTYIGRAIKIGNEYLGVVCVAYTKDFSPSQEDLNFFEIIASAIEIEEDRYQAQEKLNNALKESLRTKEIFLSMLEDNNIIRENLEKKLEELKTTQNMLIQSEKLAALGRLVAEVAHEINNPLMIISGNAQLSLMDQTLTEEIKNNLKIIHQECNRAKEIIQRLLKFSRPSSGVRKDIDVNSVIEETIKLIQHQYRLQNIIIEKNLAIGLPLVFVDEKQMQEVFLNILTNAKDAMWKGGKITVSSCLEGDYIRIDFKDTGCGMDEQTLSKIIEPFFTTKEKGTGLGLPLCYGIVKSHGGEMRITSQPKKGTNVSIYLPFIKKEEKNA